jgi:hypothetical protein
MSKFITDEIKPMTFVLSQLNTSNINIHDSAKYIAYNNKFNNTREMEQKQLFDTFITFNNIPYNDDLPVGTHNILNYNSKNDSVINTELNIKKELIDNTFIISKSIINKTDIHANRWGRIHTRFFSIDDDNTDNIPFLNSILVNTDITLKDFLIQQIKNYIFSQKSIPLEIQKNPRIPIPNINILNTYTHKIINFILKTRRDISQHIYDNITHDIKNNKSILFNYKMNKYTEQKNKYFKDYITKHNVNQQNVNQLKQQATKNYIDDNITQRLTQQLTPFYKNQHNNDDMNYIKFNTNDEFIFNIIYDINPILNNVLKINKNDNGDDNGDDHDYNYIMKKQHIKIKLKII